MKRLIIPLLLSAIALSLAPAATYADGGKMRYATSKEVSLEDIFFSRIIERIHHSDSTMQAAPVVVPRLRPRRRGNGHDGHRHMARRHGSLSLHPRCALRRHSRARPLQRRDSRGRLVAHGQRRMARGRAGHPRRPLCLLRHAGSRPVGELLHPHQRADTHRGIPTPSSPSASTAPLPR